jgi:hypothetical protein
MKLSQRDPVNRIIPPMCFLCATRQEVARREHDGSVGGGGGSSEGGKNYEIDNSCAVAPGSSGATLRQRLTARLPSR